MNKKETCNGMPAYEGSLSKNQLLAQPEHPDAQGSPCPEFWNWLPKAYGQTESFSKYNMEVAYLAGKKAHSEPKPVAWAWTVNNGAGYTSRGIGFEQTDIPFAKHVPLYTDPPLPDYNIKLERMRELVKIQGNNGNWNYDPYMHGMYNGMEFMIAMLEDREPNYRAKPEVWLYELPPDKVVGEASE